MVDKKLKNAFVYGILHVKLRNQIAPYLKMPGMILFLRGLIMFYYSLIRLAKYIIKWQKCNLIQASAFFSPSSFLYLITIAAPAMKTLNNMISLLMRSLLRITFSDNNMNWTIIAI